MTICIEDLTTRLLDTADRYMARYQRIRNTSELTTKAANSQKFSRVSRVVGDVLRKPILPTIRPAATTAISVPAARARCPIVRTLA